MSHALCSKAPQPVEAPVLFAQHAGAVARGSIRALVGSVLMNRPTISSTPSSPAGRPATMTPNTTSYVARVPGEHERPRTWAIVASVTPWARAVAASASVSAVGSHAFNVA